MNMTNEKVYKSWPLGILEGLFEHSGIYDDSPLLDLVTNVLNQAGKIYKKIIVAAVDSNTGKYITFTESNTALEDMPSRIVSSASIPFVFPHRHIDNMTLMDGGTVWNINMDSAILRCKEIVGDDEKSIIVDIISCGSSKLNSTNSTSDSIGNFLRYRDIKSYNNGLRDVFEFQRAYPNITFRYFF